MASRCVGSMHECRVACEQFKRERLQGVARQYRRGFVKRPVTGGFSAPQVVIVHGRQIVVYQ